MPETTANYHRIPVSEGHDDHKIRTMTLSSEDGIKALYCVDCKEIITYLFDKDKWTMDEAKEWVQEHKDGITVSVNTDPVIVINVPVQVKKGAIPFHSYPLADKGESWDGPGEVSKAEVDDLKKMCTWVDSSDPDVKSSYKLPHHKADGYSTVWRGVAAAMSRLMQAKTQIPDGDRRGCYNHLAKHYKEFGEEAPEFGKEYTEEELASMFPTDIEDARTKEIIASTVRFKSYGQTTVEKAIGSGGDMEPMVRGFFTSDTQDEVGDIITKEATGRAVKKWRMWGNIRTQHSYPSGRVEKIGEDDGLAWNELISVPVDEQTRKLIEGGVLKAYSVGIIPRDYEINEDAIGEDFSGWFYPLIIHDYDLIEISYVDHPANYAAAITDVSTGKEFGEFAHRAVLYKNKELVGEINMEDTNEKDLEQEQPIDEEEIEKAAESEYVEPEVVEKEAEPVESEKSVDDSDPEPTTEKEVEQEDEFDAEKAVRELSERFDALAKFVEEEMEAVIDGVFEALDEKGITFNEPEMESDPVDVNEEQPTEGANERFEKYLADRIESIVKEQLEKFTDDLVDAMSYRGRRAKVASDESESDDEEPDTATKYLKMGADERREKMRGMLKELYPARE